MERTRSFSDMVAIGRLSILGNNFPANFNHTNLHPIAEAGRQRAPLLALARRPSDMSFSDFLLLYTAGHRLQPNKEPRT